MAEAVIGLLVPKIGSALADEAAKSAVSLLLTWISAMKELKKDISEIKAELRGMQSFLQNAERLKKMDKNINTFIEEIRELAFDIEDIIDEFTYKMGEEQGGVLPTTIKRCKNIITWHHLSKRVKEIKISLQNITVRRARFNIGSNEIKPSPSIAKGGSSSPAEYAHFFKEDDLVGIDKNRDLLLRWLKDEKQIISVWGMGGLGKTTLVTHVYNIIKYTFDACAWVRVSQSYNSRDVLLRKIIKEFFSEDRKRKATADNTDNIDNMDFKNLVQTICSFLQNKRYIIILDDVWSTNVWFDINYAFSDGNSNNKIVLTTRKYEVALLAHEHCRLELKPLEVDHSWNLFCKNAFWKNTDRICPPLLKHWAEKIVEKCCGLPIAIVSIGSLLSFKEQLDTEWENVYKDLERHLTNNSTLDERVNNILELSLEDLPYYLRNCFLYCCIFPEDYRIKRKRLIRLWVAEGFIEERERRTMEEVAEDYLNELVHRCLLQVVNRDGTGIIDSYRMHGIIRVLTLSQSKEESFCMVYEHSRTMLQTDKARRLSILSSTGNYRIEDKSQLRSILVFNNSMSSDLLKSVLRSSKLLRVLELRGAPIKELPSEICNLFNLRYLGLRETKIKELPRSIGKLKNLQILDIVGTGIEKLPKEISKLQKLRHLVLPKYFSIEGPMEIWWLNDLQSLRNIKATAKIVRNVEALTKLRTFGINGVITDHCKDLWNSITKMNNLRNLYVESESWQELRWLDIPCPPLPIQKLYLQGKFDKTSLGLAAFFGSLTNLTELTLSMAKLDEDTFPHLQALPALMVLELFLAYDGKKLHFKATSFPKLQELLISVAPKLNEVEIEKGAMPSLNRLFLHRCLELRELPHGIEYLTTLQDLFMYDPTEKLIERLRGEGDHINDCRTRVRHISKITIYFERDGEYVTERIQ